MSTQSQESVAVEEKIEIQEPGKYNVLVHDNDITSYEEVIFIVSKAFELSEAEAFSIARKVDSEGKGVCGTFSKETAEVKIMATEMLKEILVSNAPYRMEQIMALRFTIEPA